MENENRTTIPDTMRASVLTGVRTIAVETRPVPRPRPDEVLVRVASVGVCGSDAHYYAHGRIGEFVVEAPLVLGHEAAGTIVAVGESVPASRVGSRVSIEPQHPNPHSQWSREGRYNLDPDVEFYATPPIDGAFCEYVTIRSSFAYDIPDQMSFDAAALFEPLSVGIAAARQGRLSPGETVLIAGAGPIGLMCAQVARAYGATTVLVVEPDAGRRARATEFGATDVFAPDAVPGEIDAHVFIDASGAPAAIRSGIEALRSGGRCVLVGMGPDEGELPLSRIRNRELELIGVFRYANTWPTARELADAGLVDLDRMVTGRFGLEAAADAIEASLDPASIKIVVTP